MRDLCWQGSVPFAKYKKVISAKILFGNYNTFLSQKDKLVNKNQIYSIIVSETGIFNHLAMAWKEQGRGDHRFQWQLKGQFLIIRKCLLTVCKIYFCISNTYCYLQQNGRRKQNNI